MKEVGANVEDGQNLLVLWRLFGVLVRKVGVGGGCVVASLCMVPCSVTVGLGRLFAATVFTVPGHWRATGALVAALPAVLRVTAHDSRPVSYP